MTVRTSRHTGLARHRAAPALAVALAALLAGCTAAAATPVGTSSSTTSAAASGGPSSGSLSTVDFTFLPMSGARSVRPDTPLRVTADRGRLTQVDVRPLKGGASITGVISYDGLSWTPAADPRLALGTTYVVEAHAVDEAGNGRAVKSSFTTLTAKNVLRTVVTPGEGSIVGVGMPVIVTFNQKVTDRAAVERALRVTLSKPVEGSWHWFGPKEVHFRPKTYWPAAEQVRIDLALAGVDAGGGVWGDHDRTVTFGTTANAMVSTVDVTAHMMRVTRNGKLIRVIPITTGKSGFQTRGGVKVIMTKERYRVMDSTTVDIPVGSPDAYHLKVEYALRLTWTGEFVHAAPWSVAHQGHQNVSHGCTGMSTSNAAWFYGLSHIGDVVQYIHSDRPTEQGNGYTDWNIPWSTWTAGSAL